jgi:hypothetical protein
MVLDLVDRGGGSDHLTNLVEVIRKKPASGQAEYSVVVFRVQGRAFTEFSVTVGDAVVAAITMG